jgi:hypothetical protein
MRDQIKITRQQLDTKLFFAWRNLVNLLGLMKVLKSYYIKVLRTVTA